MSSFRLLSLSEKVHCTKYINGSQRPFMAMGKILYVIDNIRCFKSVDNGASFLNLIVIDLTKTAVNRPYFCHYTHRQSEILLGKIAFYEICFCILHVHVHTLTCRCCFWRTCVYIKLITFSVWLLTCIHGVGYLCTCSRK